MTERARGRKRAKERGLCRTGWSCVYTSSQADRPRPQRPLQKAPQKNPSLRPY